jgi:putative membrane protein
MDFFYNVLKGTAVGIANIIPGVSGGTVAFILGIYDKLLESIGNFIKADIDKKKEYLIFLSSVGIGVLTGIIFFAKLIGVLYTYYPEQTSFLFLGLIIGSMPYIIKNHAEKPNAKSIVSLVSGVLLFIVFIYVGEKLGIDSSKDLRTELTFIYGIKLFICGSLAAGAMVMPGISGSLLLLMIGEYHNIINFLNTRNYIAIVLIGAGAGTGILLFTKITSYFLKKHRNLTIYFIIGLIIASCIKVYPGITQKYIISDILTFIPGLSIAYFTSNKSK